MTWFQVSFPLAIVTSDTMNKVRKNDKAFCPLKVKSLTKSRSSSEWGMVLPFVKEGEALVSVVKELMGDQTFDAVTEFKIIPAMG